jgi:hypothetical protein
MNENNKFYLNFDCGPVEALDSIALKACQNFNFGNKNNWFLSFRMGKIGYYSKLYGVRKHFLDMHTWGQPNNQVALEYHISSVFFHMDSAIECLVFMLNAFGYGIEPALFINISDAKALQNIFPKNIVGAHERELVKGYDKYFPKLKIFMISNGNLIKKITDHHDVSKHRKSIFAGGQREIRSLKQIQELTPLPMEEIVMTAPYEEIIMESNPKGIRKSGQDSHNGIDKLEEIVISFCDFINNCALKAADDAKVNINIKDH